jgi:alkylresorcinol/alkylpyrone synthase
MESKTGKEYKSFASLEKVTEFAKEKAKHISLARDEPSVVSKAVSELWSRKSTAPVDQVISHGGGKDVIEALIDVIQPHQLEPSITVLEKYGNMSSPSVLFALEEALLENKYATGDDTWLVSFGAGFSAHSCRLKQL